MALTYTNFSSFDEVVFHYERIKPIKEKDHGTKRNIRPIGDRARKWERIVKINRNCYALSDGYHRGDDAFTYWGYAYHDTNGKVAKYPIGDMERYAPIIWRRHKDGSTTVRFNNMTGSPHGASISRFDFLRRHTPRGLVFIGKGDGKQYIATIQHGRANDTVYLAKNTTVPHHEWAQYKDSKNRWQNWRTCKDDNSSLVFTQKDVGVWEHDKSTGRQKPSNPRVNKELKAKYKDAMNKFFEWGMTMTPLLPLEYQYCREQMEQLNEHFDLRLRHMEWLPKYAREILVDENHPMRLAYWVMFASSTNDGWYMRSDYAIKNVQTADDLKKIRAKYNSFMNNNAGFITRT